MKNWRATIGLILPGAGITAEYDFNKYAPDGVGICTTRIPFGKAGVGPTPENLKLMVQGLESGCLSMLDPRDKQDVIMFCCTSGSLIGGPNFDKECVELIEKATGSRGLTTSTAILQAFEALGLQKLAVITPYPDGTNVAEKEFLEKNGLTVTTIVGINPERRFIPQLEPSYVYRQVKQLDLAGADGIFLSCTALDCLEIIKPLEADFNMPVVTSNQASLWAALHTANVGVKIPELGKLFTL